MKGDVRDQHRQVRNNLFIFKYLLCPLFIYFMRMSKTYFVFSFPPSDDASPPSNEAETSKGKEKRKRLRSQIKTRHGNLRPRNMSSILRRI